MCKFKDGIKFCTCDLDEFSSSRDKKSSNKSNKEKSKDVTEYVWTLFKFEGDKKQKEMGRYMFPEDDIGNGLNAEWIVLNLNCEDCFDFDYSPSEGDNLTISKNHVLSPYLSFVFSKDEWKIEHYDPFLYETSVLNHGKIKSIDQ
ncbi:hypothetical protein AB9K26_00225 [Psychroserpens sp. XS_ASV72]|uniref:hypothetical protein n=1 Tax=Psychroserpens sp. XS_ASV72 TaxID=3241293 RepID=UPI0035181795